MKLYFVRHGRTEWNQEGRFQGASGDSSLLPTAVEELQTLGNIWLRHNLEKFSAATSHVPFALLRLSKKKASFRLKSYQYLNCENGSWENWKAQKSLP